MKTKNIKVVYTYRHHQSGGVLHSGTGPCTAVPKIQMEGHWLEALGFSIGAPLIVEYELAVTGKSGRTAIHIHREKQHARQNVCIAFVYRFLMCCGDYSTVLPGGISSMSRMCRSHFGFGHLTLSTETDSPH